MELTIAGLNVERRGSGPPLLLIHGLGHRWQMWTPLLDDLARDHDVAAVDLPGFGKSPALVLDHPITIADTGDALERLLDELGWDRAHVAGNSLGGWLTYELARRGRALSACGLAPAGCWPLGREPRQIRPIFRLMVFATKRPRLTKLLRFRAVRTIMMYGLVGKPWRVPADVAVDDARAFDSPTLREILGTKEPLAFTGGRDIDASVTIAFFSRDPLIRRRQSTLDELPPSTVEVRRRGCGHIPTWDDPAWCAATIRETERSATPHR